MNTSQQLTQALSGFTQQGQHAFNRLLGRFILNGHAHTQGGNGVAFVVAQGHGHTAVGQVELLLGQTPVLRTDVGHFLAQAFVVGDGVRGEGAQSAFFQPVVHRGSPLQSHQQHARCGGVRGHACAQSKAGVHAAVLPVARDVHNVVAVEHTDERNFLRALRSTFRFATASLSRLSCEFGRYRSFS